MYPSENSEYVITRTPSRKYNVSTDSESTQDSFSMDIEHTNDFQEMVNVALIVRQDLYPMNLIEIHNTGTILNPSYEYPSPLYSFCIYTLS